MTEIFEPSKYFLACAALISALGFRFIYEDHKDNCDKLFKSDLSKSVIIFSFIFLYVKDIYPSLFFALIYYIIIKSCSKTSKNINKN